MTKSHVGEILWYITGNFSASRVEVLDVAGRGATLTYVVRFIDAAPNQPDARDFNRHIHPHTGGIRVSARKCVPLEI